MGSLDGDSIKLVLVPRSEKKDFLTHYMSYRMELMGMGHKAPEKESKEDYLSKFWNDPNNNYLLWIMNGNERIGFAAIQVLDLENGELSDLSIFRDHRGKGLGSRSMEEILRFSKYRGLKTLIVRLSKDIEGIDNFFQKNGFKVDSGNGIAEL